MSDKEKAEWERIRSSAQAAVQRLSALMAQAHHPKNKQKAQILKSAILNGWEKVLDLDDK